MNTQDTSITQTAQTPAGRVAKSLFGVLGDGAKVDAYTLVNENGVACQVITYGGTITRLHLPDRDGNLADVVLGYDELESYVQANDYAGATIGRVANRIRDGRFQMHGRPFQLTCNEGGHHLHGGFRGFDKAVWRVSAISQAEGSLTLNHVSPDGTEGYPGNLITSVTYTLTDQNELWIDYQATTDQPTPVNLTNHTYFNLAANGNILNHLLHLDADHYTPLDDSHMPTGTIVPVSRTAADFRHPTRLGTRLGQSADNIRGFNYNYVLKNASGRMAFAARLHDPESGRALELWTDQPGVQIYTGSYLRSAPAGKRGLIHGPNSGLCLESQHFPDAVNCADFPSIILQPGSLYRHQAVWKFSIA